jgi:hypothetical protein
MTTDLDYQTEGRSIERRLLQILDTARDAAHKAIGTRDYSASSYSP